MFCFSRNYKKSKVLHSAFHIWLPFNPKTIFLVDQLGYSVNLTETNQSNWSTKNVFQDLEPPNTSLTILRSSIGTYGLGRKGKCFF